MNVNQQAVFQAMRSVANASGHTVESDTQFPQNITLRCSCGWHHGERMRQNALARASKLSKAELDHYKSVVGVTHETA